MSSTTASGLPGSAGPSSRHGDVQQGGNTGGSGPAPTSTPSGFNFEPASIFDWASSHHTSHHSNNARGVASNGSPYYQQQAQQQQASQPTHSLDLVNALGGGGPQQQQTSLNPAATQQQQQQQQNINNNNNNNDDDDDEDEDDDDDDDDDDSGNVSGRQGKNNGNGTGLLGRKRVRGSGPTHRLNRKGGGRPKDFIWAYFDEHFTPSPTPENPNYVRHSAECKACGWACEQPKAFRMRQHVVHSCENLPDAEKQRVQAIQTQKDAAAELKKRSKRSDSRVLDGLGGHSPLMSAPGVSDPSAGGGVGGRAGDNNNTLNGTFGDMFSRLSGAHPNGGAGDASFFNYSALSGNGGGGDASTSSHVAGQSGGLAGNAPTGNSNIDKSGHTYKNSTTSNSSRKKRKKEDSNSGTAAVSGNWHLSSFLNPPGKMGKSPITCHVLDSSAGRPGANIKIRMDQLSQTGFMHVATGETDNDGRNNSLLSSTLKIDKNSIYKMTFYTREYFNAKGIDSFYPFVEVVFEVKEPDEHHHIALLLSPFSYTTYRGS